MLVDVRLQSLGVIREAVLPLTTGFTAVTGETGAGKTMVVTGLGLLLGSRADAGTVRQGDASATVDGTFLIDPAGSVAQRVADAGGVLDDGDTLMVTRSVSSEGRSKAFLGGRSTPVGLLSELGEQLITVHGQGEAVRLRSAAAQLDAVDRYAGDKVTALVSQFAEKLKQWRELGARIERIQGQGQQAIERAAYLREALAAIERVNPQPDEDTQLKAESIRLTYADDLHQAVSAAHTFLAGNDNSNGEEALGTLSSARTRLESVSEHDEAALGALIQRLKEVSYLAADIAAECAAYASNIEVDPARLAVVEERRAALGALCRQHDTDVNGLLTWATQAAAELLDLDSSDDRLGELHTEFEALRQELGDMAHLIRTERLRAAQALGAAVSEELHELSMPDAQLQVEVGYTDDAAGVPIPVDGQDIRVAVHPHGVDEVEFQLIPHTGAPARPLAKGASGGELSRVMLGLEVVLGAVDPVPTFIFDEVDSGVGGRAALGIGRRLARLARHSQVIVVTHLPQVAAFADNHLMVHKDSSGDITESGVRRLSHEERVEELARMLGGVEASHSAQAHASELLDIAAQERAGYTA